MDERHYTNTLSDYDGKTLIGDDEKVISMCSWSISGWKVFGHFTIIIPYLQGPT